MGSFSQNSVILVNIFTHSCIFLLGYVFTAPDSILNTYPGMFHLEDCVNKCAKDTKCLSVNYETGLCVLFSASADSNPGRVISRRQIYGVVFIMLFYRTAISICRLLRNL